MVQKLSLTLAIDEMNNILLTEPFVESNIILCRVASIMYGTTAHALLLRLKSETARDTNNGRLYYNMLPNSWNNISRCDHYFIIIII